MKNKMRVWIMRNFRTTHKVVSSVKEAKEIIRKATKNDLKNKSITDNAFGLEVWENNGTGFEWCEWYNKKTGNDITEEIDEEDESNY